MFDIPKTAWRVVHPGTQSFFDEQGNMISRDQSLLRLSCSPTTTTDINTGMRTLRDAFASHVDWYAGAPSSFLSASTSRRHALNWARRLASRYSCHYSNTSDIEYDGDGDDDDEIRIYKIDMSRLRDTNCTYFDAGATSAALDVVHPYAKDEIMFLRRIPAACLSCPYRLSEVEAVESGRTGNAYLSDDMNSVDDTDSDDNSYMNEMLFDDFLKA
jgi:hypothetical protein